MERIKPIKDFNITQISSNNGKNFPTLHKVIPSNKQNIKEVSLLDAWWDSWDSNGNKIGDFTFCYGIKICKLSVFNLLQENFKDIKGVDVKINKTERELKAKNPKRLKWLPQEDIVLKSFFSPTYFDCLPQSSLVKTERGEIALNKNKRNKSSCNFKI